MAVEQGLADSRVELEGEVVGVVRRSQDGVEQAPEEDLGEVEVVRLGERGPLHDPHDWHP